MSAPGNGTPAMGTSGAPPDSPPRPSDPAATTTTLPAVEKGTSTAGNGSGATAPAGAWTHLSTPGATPSAALRRPGEPDTDEIRAASANSAQAPAAPAPTAPPPAAPIPSVMGTATIPPVAAPVGPTGPQTFPGPAATVPPPPMQAPPMQAPPMQAPPLQPPPGVAPPLARRPARAIARAPRRPGDRMPRRAHLQLKHLDVWSVLKLACVLSVSLFFVWLVVIGVIYGLLDVTGVVDKINETAHTLYNNNNDPVTPGIVLGGALVIGVINIVLFIVLTTIGSVVYNLCADLVGGVEVTLSERG